MPSTFTFPKSVLVLLIGEVLEDPRVCKTCQSLCLKGADVTVACTNPSGRIAHEIHDFKTPGIVDNELYQNKSKTEFEIFRFPHRNEFFLKKLYNFFQARINPAISRSVTGLHENVPSSPVKAFVRNTVLMMNFRHHTKSNRKINRAMVRAFSGRTFDLVHCNDVDTLYAGNTLKESGTAKEMLYDAHEYWPGIGLHGSAANDALGAIEADGIKKADYVVTVNSMIADMMQKQHDLPAKPAVVMNCPRKYPGSVFTDSVHEPVRMLYQGKVQAFRGLEQLVLACKYIENVELTVSGEGPLTERLTLLAKTEGLSDKVRVTGKYLPDEALSIITEHDIGVLPLDPSTVSITYSSPNKLFDYAMGGLAIAANDLPFIKQVVMENGMGCVFTHNDPEKIAETIKSMIADSEKLKQYKRNARKTAEERYYWEKQFANYPFDI